MHYTKHSSYSLGRVRVASESPLSPTSFVAKVGLRRACLFPLPLSCLATSVVDPKKPPFWLPKPSPRPSQNGSQEASCKQTGKITKYARRLSESSIFNGVGVPTWHQNSSKIFGKHRSETDRPLGWVSNRSWDGFWTIFGASWGPTWPPTWHQKSLTIHLNTDRKRTAHCAWLLGRILHDFGCQLGATMKQKRRKIRSQSLWKR